MSADCLTPEEAEVLLGIYRRDVKYWENWGSTVKVTKRDGRCPMGYSWVVLRFKPGPALPCLRREMNDLYMQALQEYAEQYDLSVCIDPQTNKLMLYDPAQTDPNWLDQCILPGPVNC